MKEWNVLWWARLSSDSEDLVTGKCHQGEEWRVGDRDTVRYWAEWAGDTGKWSDIGWHVTSPRGPHTWSPLSQAASIITMRRTRDTRRESLRVSSHLLSVTIMNPLVTPPHHMMITHIRFCIPRTVPLSRSVSNGNVNSSFASPTLHTWPRSLDTPRQKSKFWQHNEQFYFGMRNSRARAITSHTMHN